MKSTSENKQKGRRELNLIRSLGQLKKKMMKTENSEGEEEERPNLNKTTEK